jgi:hypothetical protein
MNKQNEVKKIIKEELESMLDGYSTSGIEVENIDFKKQEVTIKFGLSVVPEDNYIGLNFY